MRSGSSDERWTDTQILGIGQLANRDGVAKRYTIPRARPAASSFSPHKVCRFDDLGRQFVFDLVHVPLSFSFVLLQGEKGAVFCHPLAVQLSWRRVAWDSLRTGLRTTVLRT